MKKTDMQLSTDLSPSQLDERALTSNQLMVRLHTGWVAAERGEPRDANQSAGWLEGWDLWAKHHPQTVH